MTLASSIARIAAVSLLLVSCAKNPEPAAPSTAQAGPSKAATSAPAAAPTSALSAYLLKSKATEARVGLKQVTAGARAYVEMDHFDNTGSLTPAGFPVGKTEWVPKTPCCNQPNKKCAVATSEWNAEPWRSLTFQMSDPHRFQWRYSSDGKTMTVEARGDLDCNGKFSSYVITGEMKGKEPSFSEPTIKDELE